MAIQLRRGTDAQWESNKSNIVVGEPAVTTDTERLFVGTGSGTYTEFANADTLASEYNTTTNYTVGDVVRHQGQLYVCNTATSGAWVAANWTETTVNSLIDNSIGDGEITTAKLADGAVTTAKVADSAITSAKIADGTIATGDIANSAVATAKIADDAVTGAKIADYSIGTDHILNGNVTTAKLADDSITADKIANKVVAPEHIANGINLYQIQNPSSDSKKIKFATMSHAHNPIITPAMFDAYTGDALDEMFGEVNNALDALGLSVVDGCLCVTYTE